MIVSPHLSYDTHSVVPFCSANFTVFTSMVSNGITRSLPGQSMTAARTPVRDLRQPDVCKARGTIWLYRPAGSIMPSVDVSMEVHQNSGVAMARLCECLAHRQNLWRRQRHGGQCIYRMINLNLLCAFFAFASGHHRPQKLFPRALELEDSTLVSFGPLINFQNKISTLE